MKKLLAILLAALMLATVTACSPEVDDTLSAVELNQTKTDDTYVSEAGATFNYEYVNSDTVRITAYYGMTAPHELEIPSVMNEKTVVAIDNSAFFANPYITIVTVPSTVVSIGEQAFAECDRLEAVVLPASLTSIGYGAFYSCDNLATVSFTGEEKLTAIGKSAFHACASLTDINLPSTVTAIEASAFKDCVSLESISLPVVLTSIGDLAFAGCSKLAAVELPVLLNTIGMYAFVECNENIAITFGNASNWYAVKDMGTESEIRVSVDVSTAENAYEVLVNEYFKYTLVK